MSKITDKGSLVGKLSHETLIGSTTIPQWLQPLVNYNGVYVGTTEPTDPKMLVWINPEGEANPEIDINLDNYYTKNETDTIIDSAIQSIDLTDYATKTELEQYDKSYEVDAKIAAIEIPETDLTGYAKESWVEEKIEQIEIPDTSNFATKEYVSEQIENIEIPEANVPVATLDTFGIVKPDGVTIIIKDGVLTVVGGGGSTAWDYPTQIKNNIKLFQVATASQIQNSLEVY